MAAIVELLVKIQLIDERQHDAVMSRSASRSGGHIVQQVAELGYATEGAIARAISVELGLPRIDLAMTPPEPAAVALLDARICSDRFVLPVALRENGELLWLAMADPTDDDSITLVKKRTQKRVRPAVAGPSEILRAVRTLYAAPNAGTGKAEGISQEKLAAIEIANDEAGESEAFEVVNVGDDITGEASPLSKIAKQLGVEVPANIPSRSGPAVAVRPKQAAVQDPIDVTMVDESPQTMHDARPVRTGAPSIPPKTDPTQRPQPPATKLSFEELLSPVTKSGAISGNDLTDEDLSTLEALRASMEKGALVLRALAELCVEKGVFTREEMKRRNTKQG